MNSSPGDFSPAFGHVLPERFGQPLCLMSPIGQKASVKRENFPLTPCTFAAAPYTVLILKGFVFLAPTTVFTRTFHSPRYSFASSASTYSGSWFLLDNTVLLKKSCTLISRF